MKKIYTQFILLLGVLSLLSPLLTGCSTNSTYKELPNTTLNTPLKRTEFILGTAVTLSLYDHPSDALLDEAFELTRSLEDTLSINKSGTLLDAINDNAGIAPVKVDRDTFDVIKKGLDYGKLTNGFFDITIGPLVKLWDIGFPDARVPFPSEISSKLSLVDYTQVSLDEVNQTIYLEETGMMLDLGGIGKGYATDKIVEFFRSKAIGHALIDLGGNIYALGSKPDDSLWKIGIQNPFSTRGESIGYVAVQDKSIVTSGIYERFIKQDGKQYHHILNPSTGYPFENDIAGVTIISDTSIDGDALSTSVFSLGVQTGLDFVNTLENIDAIFITKDHSIYLSKGLLDTFVLTDTTFKTISTSP